MLQLILSNPQYEVVELHTVVDRDTERVGLHGVHKDLIEAQADSLGLPVNFITLPRDSTNNSYEKALGQYYGTLQSQRITNIGFGDIFLEDLKQYREKLLAPWSLNGCFPLWQHNTSILAEKFISTGFKAVICSANADLIPHGIAGKRFDQSLIQGLPVGVDPCGENGEFHSFVYDGPLFQNPINFKVREIVPHTYEYLNEDKKSTTTSFDFANLELLN